SHGRQRSWAVLEGDEGMRRKLVVTIAGAIVFAALTTVGTLAVFSDSETVGSNAFSTGKIDIGVSPTRALVSFSGMLPGLDYGPNAETVTNNTGSSALRY